MYLNLDIRHTSKASQQSRCSLYGIPANLNPKAWLPSCIGKVKSTRTTKKQKRNKLIFEILSFVTKNKARRIVTKKQIAREYFGGFFNLIRNNNGYVDVPPIVVSLAGFTVAVLIKAYLGKILNIQCFIILAILVLIPAIISFIWDEKYAGKQLFILDEKYVGKFVNNSAKQSENQG